MAKLLPPRQNGSTPSSNGAALGAERATSSLSPASTTKQGSNRKPKRTHAYGPKFLRFLVNPASSLKIVVGVVLAYSLVQLTSPLLSLLSGPSSSSPTPNPFAQFLFLSYPTLPPPGAAAHPDRRYFAKGPKDISFLVFWVVVLSFTRQALMRGPLRALAKWAGVRSGVKTSRFAEQAYMVVYFGCSGSFGLWVMSQQKSWWYKPDEFWTDYPSAILPGNFKFFYLVQFAYWFQELVVILAGLDKPRADNAQMTFHHLVTMWLILESYVGNLEQIGLAIFVSSTDLPDFVFSFSKCINYTGREKTGNCSFVIFILVWGYLRHYQNIRMLVNVWHQFWMPTWFRLLIFVPILLLQITICFWSYRILRVAYKLVTGTSAHDPREKGETDTESEATDGEEELQAAKNK